MIIFCGGEFTAHKITVGWEIMQHFEGCDRFITCCASLGGVFEIVGAAKGLSHEEH